MTPKPGIPCPQCGERKSSVLETRARDGAYTRRRECFNGHRFSTRETTRAKHD